MKCIKFANGLKYCPKCGENLDISLFRKNRNRKDGLNGYCKNCLSDMQKQERLKGTVKREKIYRNSEKGKLVSKRALQKYRKSKKYKKQLLPRRISGLIKYSLKNKKNNVSWKMMVGYSPEELKEHLESQFLNGMSWNNFSDWHIDHIKPICAFNIHSWMSEDFKQCWSLENLQPLWAKDNQLKGAKYKGRDWRYE